MENKNIDDNIQLESDTVEEQNKKSMESIKTSEIIQMLNGFDEMQLMGIKAISFLFHIMSNGALALHKDEDEYIEDMSTICLPINSVEDYLDTALMEYFIKKNNIKDPVEAMKYADESIKKILLSGFFVAEIVDSDKQKEASKVDRGIYIAPGEYKMALSSGLFTTNYFINEFQVDKYKFCLAYVDSKNSSVEFVMVEKGAETKGTKDDTKEKPLTFNITLKNLFNIFVDYEMGKNINDDEAKSEANGAYAISYLSYILNALSKFSKLSDKLKPMDMDVKSSTIDKIAGVDCDYSHEEFKKKINDEINSLIKDE